MSFIYVLTSFTQMFGAFRGTPIMATTIKGRKHNEMYSIYCVLLRLLILNKSMNMNKRLNNLN